MLYIGLLIIFIFVLAIFILYKYRKVGKLSVDRKKFYKKQLNLVTSPANSYKEQILDLDKLYHHLLKDLGYSGTFGEILKQKPKEITDIDKIWELHKLRNKLAHDFDVLDEKILKKKATEFKKEINNLLT